MMQIVRDKRSMQELSREHRRTGRSLGLVPTMGALHRGHLSLLELARPGSNTVAVSIFVNPLQFGPHEDLGRYPRDFAGDLHKLEAAGCDLVFAPTEADFLGEPLSLVDVPELGQRLCGATRREHFRGVSTIVSKLFHVMQPDVAVFGQKDAQQAILLRRMVRDLDFPVELRFGAIVRDPDGLALSSRNAYLSARERSEALLLHEALRAARTLVESGERRGAAVCEQVRQVLARGDILRVEYVELVETETLKAIDEINGLVLLAIAAHVGSTRLIDNLLLEVGDHSVRESQLGSLSGSQTLAPGASMQGTDDVAAIILAAGLGKRMGSPLAKVLHLALGRPLVEYVLDAVRGAGIEKVVMVIGHQAERVREALAAQRLQFALQSQQLGTGHAVLQAAPSLASHRGSVVVLCGDTPLLTAATLRRLYEAHLATGASATVLTAEVEDPTGYGRVLRAPDGSVLRIVEHRDATAEEQRVREINSGLYVFSSADLFESLSKVGAGNKQGEYYLTDTLEILRRAGRRVSAYRCDDPNEVLGVNDIDQLHEVEQILEHRGRNA